MPIRIDDKVVQVWKIVQQLNDIPRNLSIQGYLKNIVEGKLFFNAYVDTWPNCSAIIVKPRKEYIQKYPVYRLGIYSKDISLVKSMLSEPGFLPNSVNIQLYGLAEDLLPAVEEAANNLGRKVKVITPNEPMSIIATQYKPEILKEISEKLSTSFYSSSVKPESVPIIAEAAWDYWKDFYDSKDQLEKTVELYRSLGVNIGIYEKETHKLAAWMLSNVDNCGIMGQTMKEYEGHNLQLWVLQGITALRKRQNGYTYSHFGYRRTLSEKAQKLLGAIIHDNERFVHCVILKKVKPNI